MAGSPARWQRLSTRSKVGAAVFVALLLVVIVGCGTTDPPPDPAPSGPAAAPSVEPVPGVRAEAVRLRTDEAVGGRFQVRRFFHQLQVAAV